jgi:23S rRNA (guanosine2251-2'-O)-methyltransferase
MGQWIYGKNAVTEAIEARRALKVYVSHTFSDATLLRVIQAAGVTVERVSEARLKSLVQGNHQGIIADVKPFSYRELSDFIARTSSKKDPLVILLDEVQDPQNFGAIIRNAVGLYVDAIIVKKMNQVDVTPVVSKVASGALEHIDIIQVSNLSQAMETLKKAGYWFAATTLSETSKDYRDFDYRGPIGLIFGSEGNGVSPLVSKRADVLIKIPLSPKLESFNVASSVAIVLAEVYRQRHPL